MKNTLILSSNIVDKEGRGTVDAELLAKAIKRASDKTLIFEQEQAMKAIPILRTPRTLFIDCTRTCVCFSVYAMMYFIHEMLLFKCHSRYWSIVDQMMMEEWM